MSASASFVIDTAIRGYHVYKDIWPNPIDEEQLTCERKVGNSHDPLAIAIKKLTDGSNMIVGHVPRHISPLCSVFIRRGGSITCVVARWSKAIFIGFASRWWVGIAVQTTFLCTWESLKIWQVLIGE